MEHKAAKILIDMKNFYKIFKKIENRSNKEVKREAQRLKQKVE